MSALREQILSASDISSEVVTVPEWGGAKILVKGMTGTARNQFLREAFDEKTGKPQFDRMYPEIIIATAHDPETGDPIFGALDRDALNSKAASATERLAKVGMRLSGLDDGAVEAGKADSTGTESAEPTSP